MTVTNHIISAVDHVVEHPQVWTQRLSKAKFADRIPHLESAQEGNDCWIVDGKSLPLADVARVGAVMADRVSVPQRWNDIPKTAYDPTARLKAMDEDGIECAVLYPSLPGFSGETFGAINDSDLEPTRTWSTRARD